MGALIAKLYRSLFSQQEVKLLLVGLDSAGKTTVLYRLKLGEVVAVIPTSGYNVETVTHKNYYITMWDFGGRNQIRPLWRDHSKDTQGVIFVIDSNDMERMEEASNELKRIESEFNDACLLVLANKQDLPNAMPTSEIASKLGLEKTTWKKWHIQGSCAKKGDGLYEGLEWLCNNIAMDTWNKKNEAYNAQQDITLTAFSATPSSTEKLIA